jgi:hypothetical protein
LFHEISSKYLRFISRLIDSFLLSEIKLLSIISIRESMAILSRNLLTTDICPSALSIKFL